jgi:hypothetical protein
LAVKVHKLRRIILEICVHLAFTIIFSLIIYLKSGNLGYIIIFILGGILIDVDHLVDYSVFFKKRFNLKDFLNATFLESGKIYLILHSWEINLIVFLLGLAIKSNGLLLLALSLTIHLSIDNLQRKNLLIYFFIYRIIKKFDAKVLIPERFLS